MKKVVTLDRELFGEVCASLGRLVLGSGFEPEVVLGIESGGRYVARLMMPDTAHCYVALRRPGTKSKTGIVASVLRCLPYVVSDALRRLESWIARVVRRTAPEAYAGPLPAMLKDARRILVVDDAVDSGATMHAVCEAVRRFNPAADIRTAVVVRTLDNAIVVPDFCLYDNVLIRFPWSADMKI